MLLFSGHGAHVQLSPSNSDLPSLECACGYRSGETPTSMTSPAGELGRFGYLFPDASAPKHSADTVRLLDSIADAMIDAGPAEEDNSSLPAIFTYLGQFIDHDVTANTDRDNGVFTIDAATLEPLERSFVTENLFNLRTGALDLDSLYGGSAAAPGSFAKKLMEAMRAPFDRALLFLGTEFPVPSDHPQQVEYPKDIARDLLRFGRLFQKDAILSEDDLADLPPDLEKRFLDENGKPKKGVAVIGDGRNDENLAVAQLHLSFARFHNNVVQTARRDPSLGAPVNDPDALFEWAKSEVRRIYQWLVVNVYLRSICDHEVLDDVLVHGAPAYMAFLAQNPPARSGLLPMPLEFSVAAFRFGHTMARSSYDWNVFFGRNGVGIDGGAARGTFHQLQLFTGNGAQPLAGLPRLPSNWVSDMSRLLNLGADARPDRNTRKLDTRLAPPLFAMRNEPEGLFHALKKLPRRNLRRGQLLNLPTAQACLAGFEAQGVRLDPLTPEEIASGPTGAQVIAGDFVDQTPLWFYVLKEAEVKASGEHLGPLGSRLVAETLVGLVAASSNSYWHMSGSDNGRWHPVDGVRPCGEPITSLEAFMRAAGMIG
ncbi:peroxidase [Labrenzia sp. VG12]|nr:peroxidase [Labrenzia sp. VG12]